MVVFYSCLTQKFGVEIDQKGSRVRRIACDILLEGWRTGGKLPVRFIRVFQFELPGNTPRPGSQRPVCLAG